MRQATDCWQARVSVLSHVEYSVPLPLQVNVFSVYFTVILRA